MLHPADEGKPRGRARPLVGYVLALAAAMTLPPLCLAGVSTWRYATSERHRLTGDMQASGTEAMAQVDRYLTGRIAMLQALATSPALDGSDYATLNRQARELLDLQGTNIVLRDLAGQQLVNTRVPYGTTLPRVPLFDTDLAVVDRKMPVISGLYPGTMAKGPLVRAMVPVIRDGIVRSTMTSSLPPEALAQILADGMDGPALVTIADRDGRILARSRHDPRLVGTILPDLARMTGPEGTWLGEDAAGVETIASYRRSPLSGWIFTATMECATLTAPVARSVAFLGLLAVILGALALAISLTIVRAVVGAQRRIADAAEALGRGEVVLPPHTAMRETDAVGRRIADASLQLRLQADALLAANQDLERRVDARSGELRQQTRLLQATLDNMDQGLMFIAADGTVPIINRRAVALLDLPETFAGGAPSFGDILLHQVGTGEFRDDAAVRALVARGGIEPVAHAYERTRPNGTVLEVRTVPITGGSAVRTFTDVTARKAAEREAHRLARHDALTGLPNRLMLRERLEAELARIAECGDSGGTDALVVMCLDLDRFKVVNDTLGHPSGDALLRMAGARIREMLPEGCIVARLGGDEFAVVQTVAAPDPDAASALGLRLVEALGRPFDLAGKEITVGTSVGIAIAPGDGTDADTIFKNADLALYDAKAEGRNTAVAFHPRMHAAVIAQDALRLDLGLALLRSEFELHFQPLVGIREGTIIGFEALLRWRHPERGLVGPDAFIPLAEATRLIVPIGAWVLREACREALAWPSTVRVHVNVSAVQAEDGGLADTVLDALATTGLAPERLQLEITETVLMRQIDGLLPALTRLRAAGVGIALDDFGTGYSSLGCLKDLPLDTLKIDRSFIRHPDDAAAMAIFAAMVQLGNSLGLSVVAEGVETEAQLGHAVLAGCREIQGYLFSRSVPPSDIARLLPPPTLSDAA